MLVAAILLFYYLALSSVVGDSPTMDEQNHLGRGLAFLASGDPRFSLEHPPLVNVLSALPVHTLLDLRLPLDHPIWQHPQGWYQFGELLLWEYNQDVTRMIFLARLPIIWLTMGLALVGYYFASAFARCYLGRDTPATLFAGLLAFILLLFDPNILAHGRYTTTDLGGTLFLFLAAFLLWRLWRAPAWSWRRLALVALGLGLAFGSKLSTLAFVPIFGLLALLPLYGERLDRSFSYGAGRRLAQVALAGIGSLLVVWALFGFQWGSFYFQYPAQPDAGGPLAALLGDLNETAGPMPTFWAGIEQILFLSSGGRPSFLLGEQSTEGFRAYFPVAFLAKTPLITLLLLGLALAAFLAGLLRRAFSRADGADEGSRSRFPLPRSLFFLLLPALLYFLISMSSALNIGYRHLLPMLPFLYTFMGVQLSALRLPNRTVHAPAADHSRRPPTSHRPPPSFLPVIALFLLLLPALRIHPHYLSFFNPLFGGPDEGYQVLVDSNVDWGQDLLRLQEWMTANEVAQIKLSWFGSADPDYYGIEYDPLPGLPRHFNLWWEPPERWPVPYNPEAPPAGVYAISASNLWELPREERYLFNQFQNREPDARVGYSILIYRVEE